LALRLITAHDPESLLRGAAEGFLTPRPATKADPFPTVPYLLALRQGGLRDDLLDIAAADGIPGWFEPPLCIFHELAQRLGVAARPILGDYERMVSLARILRQPEHETFAKLPRPDVFVDAVDILFGELLSNGVSPESFRNALDKRSDRDDFEKKRDADLCSAYRNYLELLERAGKTDGRDQWLYCASEIASGRANVGEAIGGRREIRIFGLADLRGGWSTLLNALDNSPDIDDVIVYSSAASLNIGAAAESMSVGPNGFAAIASRLFETSRHEAIDSPKPMLVSAPDVEREHDDIARRIRHLIDNGASPRSIAVVSRKARPHMDFAVDALKKLGIPVMARQRFVLNGIPSIRAISTLFKAAANGWTRAALIEIARQPYLNCPIDSRVINYVGYRRRVVGLDNWETALRSLESETRRREERIADGTFEADERGPTPPPAQMVAATREGLSRFAVGARALDVSRSVNEWLTWLGNALDRDTFAIRANAHKVTASRFDVIRRDLEALTGVSRIVREWRDALEGAEGANAPADTNVITIDRFHEELTAFLTGDAAIWTPATQGVQVLEGSAAAYRCFDHVFIVGMQAGGFPALAPRSPILDETERAELANLGLPIDTREVWDQREQELFRVIAAGARSSLTISRARLDEKGREVVHSAFVDAVTDVANCGEYVIPSSQVVIEGTPLFTSAASLDQAVLGATIERIRATQTLSRYNGSIESPALLDWLKVEFGDDRLWSPTQLEEFAKCPWAYFSKRALRLEKLDDPDEDMDKATRGSILHLSLNRFYDAAKAKLGAPVFLLPEDWSWVEQFLNAALDTALDESSWKWLGHPVLRDAQRSELFRILRGFIEWEMGVHVLMMDPKTRTKNGPRIRTGADQHEVAFDNAVFESDGVKIRYRGSIDRVDVSVDERAPDRRFIAAIDYKTTEWSTPGGGKAVAWSDGVVIQVPLYAHALEALRPGWEIARVEYEALKSPKSVHSLELYTIDKKTHAVDQNQEAADKMQMALNRAVAHVRQIRDGDFPAEPPDSCKCPPWCHGRDICRIPGGPRELRG
jgi:ATP-dependent helicase/nuclease subunit B